MGKVNAQLAMSLDGFIADKNDGCDELFGFYGSGDIPVKLSEDSRSWVSQVTADLLYGATEQSGATVVGRRLYDITNGWDGTQAARCRWSCSPTTAERLAARRRTHPLRHRGGGRRGQGAELAGGRTCRSPARKPRARCWTRDCSTRSWSAWSR